MGTVHMPIMHSHVAPFLMRGAFTCENHWAPSCPVAYNIHACPLTHTHARTGDKRKHLSSPSHAQSEPPQTDGLQRAAAAVLGALVVVSCLQLALATNITRLPAETLQVMHRLTCGCCVLCMCFEGTSGVCSPGYVVQPVP